MSKTTKKKMLDELLEEALVPEEEQPYEVPGNWVWTRFGNVAKLYNGYAFKSTDYQEKGIPVIRISDICGKDTIPANAVRVLPHLYDEKFVIKKGDLIIAMSGATTGKTGIYNSDEKALQNQRVGNIKEISDLVLFPKFKNFFVLNNSKEILKKAYGGAQPNISGTLIEQLKFPLPPLNEQKLIAKKLEILFAKLDEAKRLIEEVKDSIEPRWETVIEKALQGDLSKEWRIRNTEIESAHKLVEKIQAYYKQGETEDQEAIPSPYQLPSSWKWVRLSDVMEINPPKKRMSDVADEQLCTFIPMPAVSDKTGEIAAPEIREFQQVKKGYTFFIEGDILFAKITPCMENGKTAIAENLINGFGYGSTEFHVIRTNPHINSKLIYYLLRSKKFRSLAKYEMTGAVGQQRVPKIFLENYLFPLPPKEEQDGIVQLLDKLHEKEMKIQQIESLEDKIELIRQSILNKAFRGELGTNDQTEESAIELLKEVLESRR